MTDDRDTPAEEAPESSTGDDEIEIEVTRDRATDRQHSRHGDQRSRDTHSDPTGTESGLGDELGRIDVMTTADGYIEGRVTDVTGIDATTVRLTVALPHGETAEFTLEKPIPWSREFLLARLVEDVGYDAASIGHIVGESVYVARTDLEADHEEPWWESSIQTASETLLESLSGGRYRLQKDATPEWRLVDPLERPETTTETSDSDTMRHLVGMGLVLGGPLLAAAGAVIGATGSLVLSSAVLGYALLGIGVVIAGLVLLEHRR